MNLRWIMRDGERVLQSARTHYKGISCEPYCEWQDVPTVHEEPKDEKLEAVKAAIEQLSHDCRPFVVNMLKKAFGL